MKLAEAVNNIKALLEAIINQQDLNECYRLCSFVYKNLSFIEEESPERVEAIRQMVNEMIASGNIESLHELAKKAMILLPKVEKAKTPASRYFDIKKGVVYKSKAYLKDCETYRQYNELIAEKESEIENAPFYIENLHEVIKYSKRYKDKPHARLTKNLRIIYEYDSKRRILTYLRIIDHDELRRT